ncbi:hypothetical protein AVEN_214449-1 [Araneus ventricosus]|uniref:Neurotransmitter-gated ion-channel ligand-binding domain-containing protein n=1 Tax=Araneus ventricosus TaxID=182803 RepID=A0A4Y2NLP0_ARAVE|nr:hypothetical protein AVEN_214449-1 [Araneus ventricosus]
MAPGLLVLAFLLACREARGDSNADAKRLYDDLINGYNALIRPVGNNSDRLTVKMGLKLSQLIDVVSTFPSPLCVDARVLDTCR